MFFEEERRPTVVQMVLRSGKANETENRIQALQTGLESASEAEAEEIRAKIAKLKEDPARKQYFAAMDKLLPFQRETFEGLFEAMDGLPVIIRLIDPPMHEFLPPREELIREVTELRCTGENPELLEKREEILRTVESMHEINPMLGLRGTRAGIMYRGLTSMQVRAVFQAACRMAKKGIDVHPEVMIPLVSHINELRNEQVALEKVAKEVMKEEGIELDYQFGTMIEVPRAALTADQIAELAQFFSFGTNDLTQTTYGISRDDAETGFLVHYLQTRLLKDNPFTSIDPEGVGRLMQIAIDEGKKSRDNLEIGVCGEHGGDPKSIHLCHKLGVDYVSCSPFRVPIARLAAAHAALK
jgi:pyruvate,orthophosphate dikinase